jgi:hypothetical protein
MPRTNMDISFALVEPRQWVIGAVVFKELWFVHRGDEVAAVVVVVVCMASAACARSMRSTTVASVS